MFGSSGESLYIQLLSEVLDSCQNETLEHTLR